jgi:hypothetical protein
MISIGDLVLGLDRAHAVAAVARERVQQVGGGRDRIGAEDERQAGLGGRRDQPERRRVRAVDVAVRAGQDLVVGLDLDLQVDQLRRLAEAPAGAERGEVGLRHRRLAELGAHPSFGDVRRPVIEPAQDAEREQVLGLLRVAAGDAVDDLDGAGRERAHRDPLDRERLQRAVLERVGRVARLLHRAHGEGILIEEDRRASAHERQVGLQCCGIHRHQHVGRVARREDVAAGEVDLERADAGHGARGGADLGGEVRQRREVVAEHRRGIREAAACQLHPVAGVSGEANDHTFAGLAALHRMHSMPTPR